MLYFQPFKIKVLFEGHRPGFGGTDFRGQERLDRRRPAKPWLSPPLMICYKIWSCIFKAQFS